MPSNQLGDDGPARVGEIETTGLRRDLRVEDALKQDVAQLFSERVVVAAFNGVDGFVGLLDQKRRERRVGLLAIPRAAMG